MYVPCPKTLMHMLSSTLSRTDLLPVKEGRQGCGVVSPRHHRHPIWLLPTPNHLQLLLQVQGGNDWLSSGTMGSEHATSLETLQVCKSCLELLLQAQAGTACGQQAVGYRRRNCLWLAS